MLVTRLSFRLSLDSKSDGSSYQFTAIVLSLESAIDSLRYKRAFIRFCANRSFNQCLVWVVTRKKLKRGFVSRSFKIIIFSFPISGTSNLAALLVEFRANQSLF